VPCVTLRENTERPETIEVGANLLVGSGCDRIRGGERNGKCAAGVGKSFCGWQCKCQDSEEYFGDEGELSDGDGDRWWGFYRN